MQLLMGNFTRGSCIFRIEIGLANPLEEICEGQEGMVHSFWSLHFVSRCYLQYLQSLSTVAPALDLDGELP